MTKIREIRKKLEITQSELARKADLFTTNLSRLERGASKAGEVVQNRVATALGLQPNELFDEKGWPLTEEAAYA